MTRCTTTLETVFVDVPETALATYEAALRSVCDTVGLFVDEQRGLWRVEGVKPAGAGEAALAIGLALAAAATGVSSPLQRHPTAAEGWFARTHAAFPEQRVGRFAIRGTHLPARAAPGRIALLLDAGAAFGSGEHGSTRGCLKALQRIGYRRPRRIVDIGTGSGILALAASRLLHRRVLATDVDPWALRVASRNAARNHVRPRLRLVRADGWRHRELRRSRPYDLVFANILARPLCAMARELAPALAPGGTAILSGLLASQAPMVLAAHRRVGLRLDFALDEGAWRTLVLRKPFGAGAHV
jgi:ribosomal protein L11 methyltransferase